LRPLVDYFYSSDSPYSHHGKSHPNSGGETQNWPVRKPGLPALSDNTGGILGNEHDSNSKINISRASSDESDIKMEEGVYNGSEGFAMADLYSPSPRTLSIIIGEYDNSHTDDVQVMAKLREIDSLENERLEENSCGQSHRTSQSEEMLTEGFDMIELR
jgi:hypothetical protein